MGVQVSNVLPQLVAMDGVCVPIVRAVMQLLMLALQGLTGANQSLTPRREGTFTRNYLRMRVSAFARGVHSGARRASEPSPAARTWVGCLSWSFLTLRSCCRQTPSANTKRRSGDQLLDLAIVGGFMARKSDLQLS